MDKTYAIFAQVFWLAACCFSFLVIIGTIALGVFLVKRRHRRTKNTWVHGTAKLASPGEASRYHYAPGSLGLGYERNTGQFLGLNQKQQEEHVLVVGPTGRGKSTCIILPGLLTEDGHRSVFAIDPKNELHRKTAGALARQYQVWRFAPTESSTSEHYNPLDYVHSMEDAQDLARAWIENTGRNTKTPFFERNIELILTAAILHLRHAEPTAPFSRLADILCMPFGTLVTFFSGSQVQAARTLANTLLSGIGGSPQLIAGFTADLANRLMLLNDPEIRTVTSNNDIDFSAMSDPTQQPAALFLSIPMSQAQRLKPLSALFLMQMFRHLIRDAERHGGQLARPVSCYLDEFANAGRIPHFEHYIATLRSMRVSLLLAIQNFSQLDHVYSRDITPTILSNSTTHLVFPGCGKEECDFYSARMGDTTIEFENESIRYGRDILGTRSYSQQQVRRRLMTPDEVRTMPADSILLLSGASRPVLLQTLPYYHVPALVQQTGLPVKRPAPAIQPPQATNLPTSHQSPQSPPVQAQIAQPPPSP